MKYSFMTFSTPQLTLEQVLKTAEMYGYDGVEFRLDAKHAHGVEVAATAAERRAMRAQIAGSGIFPCCLATSIRYADPAMEADMIKATHERIDLAGDLGAPAIRVFGGTLPREFPREKAIEHVAACLKAVAGHAAERKVAVCLETHDDWCDPANVAAVLKRVDHPAVACNWDVMHPVRMGFATVEKAFEILKPWIRHTHLHDGTGQPNLQLLPIGEGIIDHRAFVRCLKGIHFKGYLSGEWIGWEPFEIHLPRELATLKQYEAQA